MPTTLREGPVEEVSNEVREVVSVAPADPTAVMGTSAFGVKRYMPHLPQHNHLMDLQHTVRPLNIDTLCKRQTGGFAE